MLAHDSRRHVLVQAPDAAHLALRRRDARKDQGFTPDLVHHDVHAGRLCVLNCRLQDFERVVPR